MTTTSEPTDATVGAGTSDLARWEEAYRRFETPSQERRKFRKRLRCLGVDAWDRSLRICELMCGRGNGLVAWSELGFANLEGLDLSSDLVGDYSGPALVQVGDVRDLPYESETFDVVAVQGGLHHLHLMDDLDRTLDEIRRVLKPGGRLLLVEPWQTPFLRAVHAVCEKPAARRAWGRLDAFHTMCELESETYDDWRGRPEEILCALRRVVDPEILKIGRGKLMLVGVRRETANRVLRSDGAAAP